MLHCSGLLKHAVVTPLLKRPGLPKYNYSNYRPISNLPYTVVPALGGPRRERPLAVCGHVINVPTHSTLNYLRSADTCLTRTRTAMYWLSVPAITDSVNKCSVFGGHFNPNSLAHTLSRDRQYAQYFPCCCLVTTGNISYREYTPA